MGSLRNLGKKCRDEVNNFIPTPVKEFEKLNLLIGEKILIQYIDICPTTHLTYVTEIKNADVICQHFIGHKNCTNKRDIDDETLNHKCVSCQISEISALTKCNTCKNQ